MAEAPEERRRKRLERFRETTRERVWRVNLSWIQFEQGEAEDTASAEILRELHTLKGEASLMGFVAASELAHAIEDAMQASRESGVVRSELGDALLQGLDSIVTLIAEDPSVSVTSDVQRRINDLRLRARGEQTPLPGNGKSADPVPDTTKLTATPGGYAVRVTRQQLDQVRDIIGELLLTRTRLDNTASALHSHRDSPGNGAGGQRTTRLGEVESSLRDDVLRMGNLVSALEDITRELRMVPIGVLFEQFPRAARDLARELGKKVSVNYEGQALELDREVLEALSEPLLHLVRNAVDHGVETPDVRTAQGKPDTGLLRLSARMAGRMLEVEIADDGAGVDRERVRTLAIERGVIEEQQADITDDEILRCLVAPGVTTRDAVTRVSGRGIGLDVAYQTVRALGGTITLWTEYGRGTAFKLSVPISVAITSVVMFRVGEGRYALPSTTMVALLEEAALRVVNSIDGVGVHYGGAVIPLVDLATVLEEPSNEGGPQRSRRLMIVQIGARTMALAGSSDHSQRDVVLKSAGKLLSPKRLVSAGIALEDGNVALVLSPPSVAALTRSRSTQRMARHTVPRPAARTVLVADDSPIVLDLIAETLRSHGLTVLEASDGEQAFQKLREHPEIDMLVTDVEMPRLDGLQLVARIRAQHSRRIPAIVVSTKGSDDDKKAALQVGADAYLVKSDFSRESLWSLVSRYVG